MQAVVETSIFTRQAEKLFSDDEKLEVISFLAANPYLGDEITGTGGVRKLRVPASGRGKRGGARLIYYVFSDECPFALFWSTERTRERICRLSSARPLPRLRWL